MKHVAALLIPVALIALAAGCDSRTGNSAKPKGKGGTTTRAAADDRTPVRSTPRATPKSTPSPRTSQTSKDCRLTQLDVGLTDGEAGSTHRSAIIVFRNTGSSACSLTGYPGVAGLDATGAQQDQAKRTTSGYLGGIRSGRATRVTLAPGATASATVEASAAGTGPTCPAYPRILVTPPNETRPVRLDWPNDGCTALEVHPVVAGRTGSR